MLAKIAADIAAEGGRAYYVGGYVRDRLLHRGPTQGEDIDIEVHGLSQEQLGNILSRYGTAHLVGKSFQVLKIGGHREWDFTLPLDPDLPLAEACGRRDFTINAMMMDILSGAIVDFYGGQADLDNQIIRHTRPEVFERDPLRAYRAFQIAARFSFTIHSSTLDLISNTNLGEVNPERIFLELKKLLLLSSCPSIGLRYMLPTGVLERMHPLLYALTSCLQKQDTHPEGDVWEHTLLVVDQAARLRNRSSNPEALMLAALLHDLGKPNATIIRGEQITTHGHDRRGEKLARQFLEEFTRHRRLIESVALLVKEHMQPLLLYKQRELVGDKEIRHLVNRINLLELLLLAEADYLGRGLERDFTGPRSWLLDRVRALGLLPDARIEPLVRGRDLVVLGLPPGPAYAPILAWAFDLQLEGKSKEEILLALRDTRTEKA